MNPTTFSVCVYCGSRDGSRPEYGQAAKACGQSIGQRGWQLVYGGGHCGLMGQVADAALAQDAHVVGVIPTRLIDKELAHAGVSQLHVVANMHERKQVMADHADAFVALPGGIGTLEELFEVWTWHQLGYHQKPLGLLNVAGYYDDLIRFIERSQADGFLWPDVRQLLLIDTEIDRLLDRLHGQAKKGAPSDLSAT
jgi:uncharacterized protein (TIGR00730 family)